MSQKEPDSMPDSTKSSLLPGRILRRVGTVMKMGMILFLLLILLIPLNMIRGVLYERISRRNEAVAEISSTWGAPQKIAGPVLVIPYRTRVKVWKDEIANGRPVRIEVEEEKVHRAFFLPETLRMDGEAQPKELYRGIYAAIVYTSQITLAGKFAPPDFSQWKISPVNVLWDEAFITLAVSDLRGAQDALRIQFAGQSYALVPGCRIPGYESGVQARLKGLNSASEGWEFSVPLKLNGSEGVRMAPFGMSTEASWKSDWPDPSFQGAFLPAERVVRADGFSAEWKISYYGRGYPQQWTDAADGAMPNPDRFESSLFGVDFIQVLDGYRHAERAIKYGALFFVLIFTAFFLFEALVSMRIHPFQYSLVGAALCLFYLALLALSEFISFSAAYAVGAVAATLMISLYSAKVLKGGRQAMIIAGLLALIYGFLYVILRLQDYSLLAGTIGLFLALAAVMYVTRNMDWYARDRE